MRGRSGPRAHTYYQTPSPCRTRGLNALRSCSDRVKLWREVTNICFFFWNSSPQFIGRASSSLRATNANELRALPREEGRPPTIRPTLPFRMVRHAAFLPLGHSLERARAHCFGWAPSSVHWWQKCCRQESSLTQQNPIAPSEWTSPRFSHYLTFWRISHQQPSVRPAFLPRLRNESNGLRRHGKKDGRAAVAAVGEPNEREGREG